MWRSTDNFTIRKVTEAGVVTTIAGSPQESGAGDGAGARHAYPVGIVASGTGNLYVTDEQNHTVRRLMQLKSTLWSVSTLQARRICGHRRWAPDCVEAFVSGEGSPSS